MAYYPSGYNSSYLGGLFAGPSWVYQIWQPGIGTRTTQVLLSCYSGSYNIAIVGLNGGTTESCCTIVSNYSLGGASSCCGYNAGNGITITSTSINPFSLTCSIANAGGCSCQADFYGSLTITGPTYGVNTCCQKFHVGACNSQNFLNATVNVYDTMGGTLLASGLTSGTGYAALMWSGSYNVYVTTTESSGRFIPYGSSLSLTPASTYDLGALSPTSGYICQTVGVCLYPLPSTLYCTFVNAGAQVFTYAAGNWTSSFTYLTIAYVLNLAPSRSMTATKAGVGFTCTFSLVNCPVTGPFSGKITPSGIGALLGNGTITE